ncbi:hypothetical protein F4780DRAFT_447391 [Xylariomycetidae sp. FL0641]|nr:hypothetical protein F4780DRAFT_447391 [Xylariomycetidae sp. FL0641]
MARFATTNDPAAHGPKPSGPYEPYRGPPNKFNMGLRAFSSVPLMVLLYSASMPFTPVSWVFPVEGSFFADRLVSGLIVIIACYFQYCIASLNRPVAISLPGPGHQTIRNGRMQAGSDIAFVWQTSNYWPYAACETMLLILAEFGPSEMLRRSIVCGVLAGLWLVGWHATPQSYKDWAWGHIKELWFWMVLRELLDMSRYNPGRRPRRF